MLAIDPHFDRLSLGTRSMPAAAVPHSSAAQPSAGGLPALHGRDGTGVLRVRLRYHPRDRSARLTFSFELPESVLPQAMVPVLRLIALSRPGRFLEVGFAAAGTGRMRAPITTSMTPASWEPGEAQLWADAFDDLAQLQTRTHQFFPLPDDFGTRNAREVKDALALLDGKEVVLRGDTVSVGANSAEALTNLGDLFRDGMLRVTNACESTLFTFGEHEIDLGPCTEIYTMDKILNMKEARRDLAARGHATVVMRIAERFPAVRYLGPERPSSAEV
ncbi:hypothetical protein ACFU6S_39140 [Streptomyces sp. NPDC057456]|uniref:hypothetical protein n=1 Tax=Streptomyces sp. NPDC057456 TaxID=3346139 RepID=UPI00369103C0